MIEHAFAVFVYSRRTHVWLTLALLFPTLILFLGAYFVGSTDTVQLPAHMRDWLSTRLLRRYDGVAIFIGVSCLIEALRSYRRDWKRF
jgi:hypothetical protein